MSETNEEMLEQMSDETMGGPIGNLVTIATFPEPLTANLARTALEGAGIPSFLLPSPLLRSVQSAHSHRYTRWPDFRGDAAHSSAQA